MVCLTRTSRFDAVGDTDAVVMEIGPRLNFCTAFSTNAVSVCRAVGLDSIRRLERSARYQLIAADRLQVTNLVSPDVTGFHWVFLGLSELKQFPLSAFYRLLMDVLSSRKRSWLCWIHCTTE